MKQGIQFNMKHIYNNYRYAVAFLGVGCVNIHIEEVIYKLVVKDDDRWSDIPWWVPQLRLPSFPPPCSMYCRCHLDKTIKHCDPYSRGVCKSLILVGPMWRFVCETFSVLSRKNPHSHICRSSHTNSSWYFSATRG